MILSYTKDQLDLTNFHVWYKLKAASQQLLDSWKEKRMTGFRLNWRIENPTVRWTTSISEVGRSIQTAIPSETLVSAVDESSDKIYKAVLAIPEDFQNEIRNETLVIELDVDMGKEDRLVYSLTYKFYWEQNTWTGAEAHCKSEGGHLASIHSKGQQALAEKAADGNTVWLGGRRVGSEGWSWSDNSTWGFTNWGSMIGNYECSLMKTDGKWDDLECGKIWDMPSFFAKETLQLPKRKV